MNRRVTIIWARLAVAQLVFGLASVASAQDRVTKPKKGLSLERVAKRQRNPVREKLRSAIRTLKNGGYAQAAAELHRFMGEHKRYRNRAQYNLAKALYRMGAYRSALHYFGGLLAKGPRSRFYRSSLEWCLFISRRLNDDDAVNEVVAQYGGEDFPAAYRDEFLFRLARFHFDRALAIERGEVEKKPEKARLEDRPTGGKSIKGDVFADEGLFGDDPPRGGADSKKSKRRKRSPANEKSGSISLDDDLFADPAPAPPRRAAPPPSKPTPAPKAGDQPWTLTAQAHTEAANRLVAKVIRSSRYGVRARFLQGVLLYKVGRPNQALEAFKDVVRATRNASSRSDGRIRQMAFFQLARTHFGAEQPSFSIFYYDKVDRDSYAWLDALYEGSWAEFRLGNYEKALGNLLTLHAPFFADAYYPESLILKAVVYYENCRYAEAKAILNDFLKRYEPVHEELKRMTSKKQTYEAYYEALEALRVTDADRKKGGKAAILTQVLDIALSDPELERLDLAYREVDSEIRRLRRRTSTAFQATRLYGEVSTRLTDVRTSLARAAGRAVKNQLERERTAVGQLIKQAIRIDIETNRSEQERIESQLRAIQRRPRDVEKEFVEWADDEKLVWPFEGEYWRDELGTYELTLAHSCR